MSLSEHQDDYPSAPWMQGLPTLVSLIQVGVLRQPLLEGMAASIGGLDGSLGTAISTALLHECQATSATGEQSSLDAESAEAQEVTQDGQHHTQSPCSAPIASPMCTAVLLYAVPRDAVLNSIHSGKGKTQHGVLALWLKSDIQKTMHICVVQECDVDLKFTVLCSRPSLQLCISHKCKIVNHSAGALCSVTPLLSWYDSDKFSAPGYAVLLHVKERRCA